MSESTCRGGRTAPPPIAPALARNVLAVVALNGQPCPVWLLRELTGLDAAALSAQLAAAFARRSLVETPGGVEVGPAASASRIAQALPAAIRGQLHHRAATALANTAPGDAVRHAAAALRLTGQVEPELLDTLAWSAPAEPGALADLLLAADRRRTATATATATDTERRRRWVVAAVENLVRAGRGTEALRVLATELATDRDGDGSAGGGGDGSAGGGGGYRDRLLGHLAHLVAVAPPSDAFACLRAALAEQRPDARSRSTLLALLGALAARVGHPDTDALLREAGGAHVDSGDATSAIHLALGRAARALTAGDLAGAYAILTGLDPETPPPRREAALVRTEGVLVRLGLGRYEDAGAAIRQALDDPASTVTTGSITGSRMTALDCLRMVGVGELPEAAALAATTLAGAEPISQEVRAILVAVVAEIRYRRGEVDAARSVVAGYTVERSWPDRMMWTLVHGVAAGDPTRPDQPRLLAGVLADLHRSVRWLTPLPQLGPRLIRAAIANGDLRSARRVAELITTVAARAAVPLWRALAAQARGLVDRNPDALRAAVGGLRTTVARPVLADALLDLGRCPGVRPAEARSAAIEAAALYGRIGAPGDQRAADERAVELALGDGTRITLAPPADPGGTAPEGSWGGIESLTPAETRVAELLAGGATKRQVAGRLSVSFHTVDTQLRSIYQKLGIHRRLQLVRAWDRHQAVGQRAPR